MANAVREVSVGKGYDPRDFLFLAYGGTLPLFASQIAERLGISTIVIPRNSSVFCALGLLSSDFVLRTDQGVGWDLSKPDGRRPGQRDRRARWSPPARQEMLDEGFAEDQIEIQRTADIRFQGQEYELTLPMPARALTDDDAEKIFDEYHALYERTYGEGTAWKGVPASMINYSVTVVGRQPRPDLASTASEPAKPEDIETERRTVFLPAERRHEEIPVYDDAPLHRRHRDRGPGDHRRRRHHDLRAAGDEGRARRVHELRPDPLAERRDRHEHHARLRRHRGRGPPQGDAEHHQRDGDHAGPHLRLADRHRVEGLLDLPDEHRARAPRLLLLRALPRRLLADRHAGDRQEASVATDLQPGDGWIVNDPHSAGAMHQGDVSVIMPTFYEGEHIGWSFANMHVLDVGGVGISGYAPGAHDVWQEGMLFPPIRIIREGAIDSEWEKYIAANVRAPGPVLNDIRSMIAANNTAQQKLTNVIDEFGLESHREYCEINMDLSEQVLRERIEKIPDGIYEAVDWNEFDGHEGPDQLLELRLKLEVDGSDLRYHYSGVPQIDAFVNSTMGPMFGQAMTGLMTVLIYGDLPVNGGLWRPIDVELGEPGTIVNAVPPAPVSNAHSEVGMRACKLSKDVLCQALALSDDPVLRGRIAGQHQDGFPGNALFGNNQHGGVSVVFYPDNAIGGGRRRADDHGRAGRLRPRPAPPAAASPTSRTTRVPTRCSSSGAG